MNALRFDTPLGICSIGWSERGITSFDLPSPELSSVGTLFDEGAEREIPVWIHETVAQVRRHLQGTLSDFTAAHFDFSLITSFQRAVFEGALTVKPGQIETYGGLAKRIGHPVSASRAVGTALGQNPWPLLVPCHRFIGADGKMVGFSAPGGIQTKLRLLAIEGALLDL